MIRRIRDDRGRRVRVLDVDEVDRILKRGSFGSVNRYVRLGWRVYAERLIVAALAPLALIAAVVVVTLSAGGAVQRHAPWIVAGSVMVVVLAAHTLPTRSLRRVIRRLGVCWSCGYDLRELPAAEDGCVVCPECGAAWRVRSGDG